MAGWVDMDEANREKRAGVALLEKLLREGEDAFHKHYSLGMWQLCAEAANEIRLLSELATELNTRLVLAESRLKSVVHALGGTVDGHPTSSINYLQRIRQLLDIEQASLSSAQRGPE